MRRLEAVKISREASSSISTRKSAETPYKFFTVTQDKEPYLAIPQITSSRRKYIPMCFLTPDFIASDLILIITAAQIYHFGILTSSIHMAWMRAVAGRLKSDYRYSGSVVYNNFVWPAVDAEQKILIEQTAQKILDARKNYPHSTLADLYDELTMPADLRLAHKKNDRAVAAAYGFENILDDESKIVAELMKLYEQLANLD